MFNHFLIPLDGSTLAEAIVPIAQTLAARLRARVTLLHVVEAEAPATVHGDAHLRNARDAAAYLARMARRFPPAQVATHVDSVAGRQVAKGIFAHAGELHADVILLTSHGRGAWREKVFGSIAQQVLQSEQIPVLMLRAALPRPIAEFRLKGMVVPLDGSPLYEPALEVAGALARAFAATVHLLVVVPTVSTLSPERAVTAVLLPASTHAVLDLTQQEVAEYLQRHVGALQARGISARASIERGDVVAHITAAAAQADLLVMATHGRVGLDAFWSGSVAPKVLSRVRVPVLLLRVQGNEPLR